MIFKLFHHYKVKVIDLEVNKYYVWDLKFEYGKKAMKIINKEVEINKMFLEKYFILDVIELYRPISSNLQYADEIKEENDYYNSHCNWCGDKLSFDGNCFSCHIIE